ncbi:hypothetical protein [Marinobacter nauticus]|uniref:Antitoxin Xre/MbcA/ParS-like toxin-binding domain-containing protein n=1 Tax=Marinobacter nauticus TaxID=2743 RepID=A0A833N7P4_MARNT|nr:hypothetical protein [Marinobacter nauticus]KAE8545031.1 hypothetical protein F6453_2638 [Marinobacter nauticus]
MGEFETESPDSEAPERIFDKICMAWSLSDEERQKLRQRVSEREGIEGYIDISRIYRALHAIFADGEEGRADGWVRRANRRYEGASALQYMIDKPSGIAEVRGYVMGQIVG